MTEKKKVVILGSIGGGKTTLMEAILALQTKEGESQEVDTLYKEWTTTDHNLPTIDNSEKIAKDMVDMIKAASSADHYSPDTYAMSVDSNNAYLVDLTDHVEKVHSNIVHVTDNLLLRASKHDSSKFTDEEFIPFEKTFSRLRTTTYGTPEYKALLAELGPALTHHYERNDHHPEYFENGINDMDLFQLTEMLCDWKAAVERHADGDIFKSLDINRDRFGFDDSLYNIMYNTMKRWND